MPPERKVSQYGVTPLFRGSERRPTWAATARDSALSGSRASNSYAIIAILASLCCGCTSVTDYVHNGFKVGPNYGRPAAPVAEDWIDAGDARVVHDETEQTQWWGTFHDPALDSLDLHCLSSKPDAPRGRLPHSRSPRPARNRHRKSLSANAKRHRQSTSARRSASARPRPRILCRSISSTRRISASISPGNSTSGDVSGGPSSPTPPCSTPRSNSTMRHS